MRSLTSHVAPGTLLLASTLRESSLLEEIKPGSSPPEGIEAVQTNGRGLIEVRGSARRIHVFSGRELCLVSDTAETLLAELERRGIRPHLDPTGVSEFIHHGFVFAPRTVRQDVLELGVGDRLIVSDGYGYGSTCEWPWLGALSRQDEVASTDRLLELLVQAVRRSTGGAPATLMMSSGKDSVALALAIREAGLDEVRAVTFESDTGGEGADAARFAGQLGIEHRIVTLPSDAERVEQLLIRCFERSTIPCGDPTLIPFVLAASEIDHRAGERIVDGLGNDAWMGYVPSPTETRGAARSDRWFARLRPLRGYFGPESPVSAALKNRAEWNFFGGRWLRHADSSAFYPQAVDTGKALAATCNSLDALDDVDFRSLVRGRHADHNAMIQKARVAGETFGTTPSFPFFDQDLADYYFHLPESDRFDRAGFTNKVLLRRLLRERLDYDDARLGKRVFEFDGAGFIEQYRDFILHEITGCPLWNENVRPLARGLIDRPKALRKTWPALMALFQLSGWISRHAPEQDAA